MQFNRSLLKNDAKKIIRESKPNAILVALLYICITVILQYLSSSLLTGNISEAAAQKYMNMIQNGNFDGAESLAMTFTPSLPNSLLDILIKIVEWILAAGFTIFIMNTVRQTGEACVGNLLDGFGMFFRVLILHILMAVFVALWSCLFVVPGIIAAYRYRQAIYLLIEYPEKSPMQCIRESKTMMKGHKWELFVFDLSFIGWALLVMLIGPVTVWVTPYANTARMLYYDYLKALQNNTYASAV